MVDPDPKVQGAVLSEQLEPELADLAELAAPARSERHVEPLEPADVHAACLGEVRQQVLTNRREEGDGRGRRRQAREPGRSQHERARRRARARRESVEHALHAARLRLGALERREVLRRRARAAQHRERRDALHARHGPTAPLAALAHEREHVLLAGGGGEDPDELVVRGQVAHGRGRLGAQCGHARREARGTLSPALDLTRLRLRLGDRELGRGRLESFPRAPQRLGGRGRVGGRAAGPLAEQQAHPEEHRVRDRVRDLDLGRERLRRRTLRSPTDKGLELRHRRLGVARGSLNLRRGGGDEPLRFGHAPRGERQPPSLALDLLDLEQARELTLAAAHPQLRLHELSQPRA